MSRPGCAHGFQALIDPTDMSYRIDRRHDPASAACRVDPDMGEGIHDRS